MTTDQPTRPIDLVAHGLKAAVAAVRTALAPFGNGHGGVLALNADRAAVLAVAALEAAGWQPQDDDALAEEFRKGFEAGELNAALLHHAEQSKPAHDPSQPTPPLPLAEGDTVTVTMPARVAGLPDPEADPGAADELWDLALTVAGETEYVSLTQVEVIARVRKP